MTSLLRRKLRTTVRNNARRCFFYMLVGASFLATEYVRATAQEQTPVNKFRSANPNINASTQPNFGARPRPFPGSEIPANSMRPISGADATKFDRTKPSNVSANYSGAAPTSADQNAVLRWRTSSKLTDVGPNASSFSNAANTPSKAAVANSGVTAPNTPSIDRRQTAAMTPRANPNTQLTKQISAPPPSSTRKTRRAIGGQGSNPVVSASFQDSAGQTTPPNNTVVPPNTTPASPLLDPFGDRPKTPALPNVPAEIMPNTDPQANSEEPKTLNQLPADSLSNPEPAPIPVFPKETTPPEIAPADKVSPPNPFPGLQPPAPMPSNSESAPMPLEDATTQEPENSGIAPLTVPDSDMELSASDQDDVLAIPAQSSPNGYTCDEIRSRLKQDTIDKIELDVTPRFGRGSKSTEATAELQKDFATNSPVRTWRNRSGRIIAVGRLIDWRRNQAILDVEGREVAILVTDLSDADVAYVSDAWGVPHLCGLSDDQWNHRQFAPLTMTWKSSELMHKPLYFEEVGLERYGHSAGPIMQPVLSSAHFFTNIAVLPYKMGIHPMSECQYALGYYRPGNCAPRQIPAIPLSARGALMQAKAVVGAAALIP